MRDLELIEAEVAKWLTRDQLDSVAWLPADVTLIDKIRRYMKSAKIEEKLHGQNNRIL